VAVVFAFFMLVTRKIARETDPVALQAATAILALPVLLPLAFLPVADDPAACGLDHANRLGYRTFRASGVTGAVAHLFMTWSLRFAPSATLAPMQYLEIPIATLAGLMIFGDLPNGLAALGILVTIAAGLYIVARERAVARAAPPAA
jgi:drug/metabolite transporter (DMT)-like permease